jgi:hypothetical protein
MAKFTYSRSIILMINCCNKLACFAVKQEEAPRTVSQASSFVSSSLICVPVTTAAPTRSSVCGMDSSGTPSSCATSRRVASVMMPILRAMASAVKGWSALASFAIRQSQALTADAQTVARASQQTAE